MANTVYYDKGGKPRLVPSYCVFADFLGFRQQIRDSVKSGEEASIFQQFMDEIEPEIENTINPCADDEDSRFPRMWDAKVFTDNVVLGYALWSDHGQKEFGHALSQMLEFQYAVALKGHFVRGGWAVGNLFMNRNTVFGAALLDACDLESKEAIYPRVILSDQMRDIVFHQMAQWAENPPHSHHLFVDEKGTLFTNYLSEAIVDGEVRWDELDRHAELVRSRVNEFATNDSLLPKYLWLASYHNYFCGLLSGHEEYSENLQIRVTLPEHGIRQLVHQDSSYVAEVKAVTAKQQKSPSLWNDGDA
jgi:hypothetical protein